ncbi:hypothetical protein OESDEN_17183 [Oesophagostomum dentatum]|uniref:Uncharacterized protein n=1 Tax=Oesophagostomum dentatum TaxID=61180 RepID=A0A0B1SIV4_OESDE|nr:hypothetical protein OESDEN_17183 [Oesophagostomum dentatum]
MANVLQPTSYTFRMIRSHLSPIRKQKLENSLTEEFSRPTKGANSSGKTTEIS